MTRWARLTWQAPDPARLAADLERWLLVEPVPQRGQPGAFSVRLGAWELELVPWLREGPDDEPRPHGRLTLEPIVGPDGQPRPIEDTPAPRAAAPAGGGTEAAGSVALAALAWGTVDLERAATELGPWLRPMPAGAVPVEASDPHLGARTRLFRTDGLPGEAMVLAEPTTEGRLAATLARHGEGPCALYLRAVGGLGPWLASARARRVTVGPRRPGPLGASAVVVGPRGGGTTMEGPHLLLVDDPADPTLDRPKGASGSIPGGTISA